MEEHGFREVETVAETNKSLVVKAMHPKHGKVAVKIPKLVETLSEEDVDELKEEFNTYKRLSHPHLALAIDFLVLRGGVPAIVMEWCPQTLRDRLRSSGRLGLDEALRIAVKILKALTYLHSQGFAHGDVKPENILFTEDGEPKLSDLGTSRLLAQRIVKSQLTPAYLAPEQVRGVVNDKTDVYQVALVIHEMLTGELRNPMFGDRVGGVGPRELDDVLRRALSIDPRARPSSRELLEEVSRLSDGSRGPVASPRQGAPGLLDEITGRLARSIEREVRSVALGYDSDLGLFSQALRAYLGNAASTLIPMVVTVVASWFATAIVSLSALLFTMGAVPYVVVISLSSTNLFFWLMAPAAMGVIAGSCRKTLPGPCEEPTVGLREVRARLGEVLYLGLVMGVVSFIFSMIPLAGALLSGLLIGFLLPAPVLLIKDGPRDLTGLISESLDFMRGLYTGRPMVFLLILLVSVLSNMPLVGSLVAALGLPLAVVLMILSDKPSRSRGGTDGPGRLTRGSCC